MSAFTEANRNAFNDLSASYNTKPWQHKLSQQVSNALQAHKDWLGVEWSSADDERDVRLLDYACGTGAITKALGPYVKTIRGIDISENMVEKYNEAAQSSGLTTEQANAVVGDVLAKEVSENITGPDYYEFDVAVIGLGFHHFEDPKLAIKRLIERLKAATGVLVIIDFLPFSQEREMERQYREQHAGAAAPDMGDMAHTIKYEGFSRKQMEKLFTDAGLEDFGWDVLPERARMELKSGVRERTVFIAKGRRAPTVWGKLMKWVGSMQDQTAGQLMMRPDGRFAE